MKKVILAVAMALGLMGAVNVAHAAPKAAEVCKFKAEDARAALKNYEAKGFIPRQTSPDGNKVFGLMVYHNPKSADPESTDALALVLIDKQEQKELTFAVAYIGPQKTVLFKRVLKDGGKELSACFEKTLQDSPKDSK